MRVLILQILGVSFLALGPCYGWAADLEAGVGAASTVNEITGNKIKPMDVVTELPSTTWKTLKFGFQRDSVPVWAGIIASTALLYQYDGDLYEWAKGQGRRWNLGNSDKTRTVVQAGPYPLMRLPSDVGSTLYFLGDGWTHFGIAFAFLGAGYAHENTRAWNTGMQIIHGMGVSTFFNQIVKRTTGRESPNQRTEERGAWRTFPDINAYNSHTSKYDAFPSGHIMTATLVFTSIRLNYPEYDSYVLPIQVLWSTALMFQMMNNGVHWASDYPLGIAMGWAVAKMAHQLGSTTAKAQKTAVAGGVENSWQFYPSLSPDGDAQMNVLRHF